MWLADSILRALVHAPLLHLTATWCLSVQGQLDSSAVQPQTIKIVFGISISLCQRPSIVGTLEPKY